MKREKAEVAGVRWVDVDIFNENNIQWDLIQRQNYKGFTYLFPSIDLPKEGDVTKTDHLNFICGIDIWCDIRFNIFNG